MANSSDIALNVLTDKLIQGIWVGSLEELVSSSLRHTLAKGLTNNIKIGLVGTPYMLRRARYEITPPIAFSSPFNNILKFLNDLRFA